MIPSGPSGVYWMSSKYCPSYKKLSLVARLADKPAQNLMNCRRNCVTAVWGVPWGLHRVYTDLLSCGHSSIKEDLLSRYVKFFSLLLRSPAPEVAIVARIAAADIRSTTGSNLRYTQECTGLDPWSCTSTQVKMALQERRVVPTREEEERGEELLQLLWIRSQLYSCPINKAMPHR